MRISQYGQVTFEDEANAAFPDGCTEGNNSGGDCDWCQIYYDWDGEQRQHNLRKQVRRHLPEWYRLHPDPPGPGPCWAIAMVLAEWGLGKVERCWTSAPHAGDWWTHFVVRSSDGTLWDISGEYETSDILPDYKDFRPHEGWHDRYTEADLAFWRERLSQLHP